MIGSRTRSMLSGLVALLVAIHANWASAAFIAVRDPSVLLGGAAKFVASAGLEIDRESVSGGTAEGAPWGGANENDSHRVFEDRLARACDDPGSHDAGTTPHSMSTGASSAGVPCPYVVVPESTLITGLPTDLGPAFCNPPPWTPLHPPRTETQFSV